MSQQSYLWKRVVIALFLFLSSCSKPCQEWEHERVVSSCPSVTYGKVYLRPENRFRELELELSRGHCGLRIYLNAFSLEFPQEDSCSSKTKVLIDGDEVYADRFEGGQRLLLPCSVTEDIICKLLNRETVCISAGRYKSEICPRGFPDAYYKLVSNKTQRGFFSLESHRKGIK